MNTNSKKDIKGEDQREAGSKGGSEKEYIEIK